MANGRNRLEKIFSKKKIPAETTVSAAQTQSRAESPRSSAGEEATFPPPSFLRPTGSRMIARDESASSSHGDQRAHSLPESQSERVSMHSPNLSTASTGDIKGPTTRTASIIKRRKDLRHVASLAEFKFPMPPTRTSAELSPVSSTSSSTSPRASLLPRSRPVGQQDSSAVTLSRLHTPPASDHEGDDATIRDLKTRPVATGTTTTDLPTPAASPEMKPSHTQIIDPETLLAQKRSKFAPLRRRKEEKAAGLRRVQSHANALNNPPSAPPRKVLQGVNVTDFFDLEDDDIAEEVEETDSSASPADAPEPGSSVPGKAPSPPSKRSSLAAMLSNPLADTRAHGAVQVAKIAAKHNFDLVYIVNLWPEQVESVPQGASCEAAPSSRSSSTSSLLGSTDGTIIETAAGMTGRLLAAYGLSKVASPFRISAAVHAKILRHESWIEYRSNDAKHGDFSRGYGHAFHAGEGRRASCPQVEGNDAATPIGPAKVERGIVFAAYRQPGPDGKTKGCTPAELKELRADAEYLIEILIAIHKAKRRRDPGAPARAAHDMGPIPPQAEEVFA